MGNDDNNETPKEALDNTNAESVQNDTLVKSEETQDSGNLDPEDSVLSETIEEQQGTDPTYSTEDNLEKMILSTGIRVGTPVKTKYMAPFIVRANPEGLYILDISKTLARIDIVQSLSDAQIFPGLQWLQPGSMVRLLWRNSASEPERSQYWADLCPAHSQIHHCLDIWNQKL